MKLKKTGLSKNRTKQEPPIRMASAITNLDRLVQVPPTVDLPVSSAVTKKANGAKPSDSGGRLTTTAELKPIASVEARIDVGYGNRLFIRGHGSGLSWEKGVPLRCTDSSLWSWSSDDGNELVEFKLLLNDECWAQGENLKLAPGEKVQVVPSF